MSINFKRVSVLAAVFSIALPAMAQAQTAKTATTSTTTEALNKVLENVSLYGVVDIGYRYGNNNIGYGMTGTPIPTWQELNKKPGGRTGLDSGIGGQSYFGLRWEDEIGNGFKASAGIERGIKSDTGADTNGWNRLAYGAIGHEKYGTVSFGRQRTLAYEMVVKFDIMGDLTDAKLSRNYLFQARADNLAIYASPTWNGLTAKVSFTENAVGDENKGRDGDATMYAAMLTYNYKGLDIGADFSNISGKQSLEELDTDAWNVMASYDFKVVKFSAGYGQRKSDGMLGDAVIGLMPDYNRDENGFAAVKKAKQYFVGVSAPVFEDGKIALSYVNRESSLIAGGKDLKSKQYSVAYFHKITKKLSAYAAYSYIDNDEELIAAAAYAEAGDNRGYQRAINCGFRLTF